MKNIQKILCVLLCSSFIGGVLQPADDGQTIQIVLPELNEGFEKDPDIIEEIVFTLNKIETRENILINITTILDTLPTQNIKESFIKNCLNLYLGKSEDLSFVVFEMYPNPMLIQCFLEQCHTESLLTINQDYINALTKQFVEQETIPKRLLALQNIIEMWGYADNYFEIEKGIYQEVADKITMQTPPATHNEYIEYFKQAIRAINNQQIKIGRQQRTVVEMFCGEELSRTVGLAYQPGARSSEDEFSNGVGAKVVDTEVSRQVILSRFIKGLQMAQVAALLQPYAEATSE
jgi:hypothetical protein